MLKKLRRRFTALWMGIITFGLVFFYFMITGILFLRVTSGVQSTLRNYSSEAYVSSSYELGSRGANEAENYAIDPRSICVVSSSADGMQIFVEPGMGHMEADTLEDSVRYVRNGESTFGVIMKYNLFYYKTDLGERGCRIAFADASRYYNYLRDILVYDGVIFLIILLVFYFITSRLSAVFIKPVEKAWEQQQNFIADASHELKTPLTVILANTDILLSHKDETIEAQEKWIESTNEEAVHMKDLVDKMLYLAKSEAMKTPRIDSRVNISELVTKFVLQFEPVAFESGVVIESDVSENITIRADHTAVNQIIHILIDNAVKYAGLGGKVDVRLRKVKNTVYLSTRNTGDPIPPEDLPHIFERFYRSDKARTAGTGYGLGLAICKSLAESQNATVSVTSDAENGTEFTVQFKKQKEKRKNNT